jgi:hypothetical protein
LTPDVIFKFVSAGQGLVTYGLAAALFGLARPKKRLLRGFLAVLAAWISDVIYTLYVYNPAGIASARYRGVHFPESIYDNNTVAVALVAGWVGPAILLSIMGAFQAMRDDVGLRSNERTREK